MSNREQRPARNWEGDGVMVDYDDDDVTELATCEHCSQRVDVETLECMGDVYFCAGCATEWRKFFYACDHRWQPGDVFDDWGDAGRTCERCGGFVTHDTAMDWYPLVCDGWAATP